MIHCSKCNAAIPDDMIYCLMCGEKLDTETETVVKEWPIYRKHYSPITPRSEIIKTWLSESIKNGLRAAGAIAVLGVVAVILFDLGRNSERQTSNDPAHNKVAETVQANAANEIVQTALPANREIITPPMPSNMSPMPNTPPADNQANDARRQDRLPTNMPINYDELWRQKNEDFRRRQRANSMANIEKPSNRDPNVNAGRPASNVSQYPTFNQQGERLRAICRNGQPSYYQGDRFWVCGLKGGPAILYW